MDGAVLVFALTVCLLAALAVGILPIVRVARRDVREVLADSQRICGGGLAGHRLRPALVVAQISLTLVLLVAASLLGRSFAKLLETDPGYRPEGAVVMDVWLPQPPCAVSASDMTCDEAAVTRNAAFIERLTTRLRTLPGVERVGGVNRFPLASGAFEPAAIVPAARRVATDLDPQGPVAFETLREMKHMSLAERRFVLLLVALFGGFALVLATTGVYGVMAYLATRRAPEVGIRVALGARSRDVVRLLLRQGIVLALAGIGIGLVAAFALTRMLGSFLYGIGTADLATFAGTAIVLLAAAALASWIPAHRASRIDPVEALRHE